MIKLATLFSGIGAVEQALIRMGIDYEIVFACDNGDIEIDLDVDKTKKQVFSMKDKKQKNNLLMIYILVKAENKTMLNKAI